jgi:hypothetical protein
MEKERIERWLRRTMVSEVAHSVLFAAACFTLSAVVLGVTLAVACAAVWFLLHGAAQLGIGISPMLRPWIGLAVALLLLALLFRSNARATRRYSSSQADKIDGPRGDGIEPQQFPVWGTLLAYPGTGSLGAVDLLFTGPRLAMIGWSHLHRARRLRGIELDACAAVVLAMLPRRRRCQLLELLRHQDIGQPLRQLAQLRDLGGVIFFRNPPHGFALRGSWRQSLAAALAGSWEDAEPPVAASIGGKGASIAEQILGVMPDASPAEVERAYHCRIEEATDPAVVGADPDLHRIASDHARAVRSAYDEFMARHRVGKPDLNARSVERVWEQHRRQEPGV